MLGIAVVQNVLYQLIIGIEHQSFTAASEHIRVHEAEADSGEEKEPEKTTIFYVTDEVQQSQYINMFKEEGT